MPIRETAKGLSSALCNGKAEGRIEGEVELALLVRTLGLANLRAEKQHPKL